MPAPYARRHLQQPLIDTPGPPPDVPPAEVRLVIGVVIGVHGVSGELKVRPLTDNPEQFEHIRACYFGDEEKPRRIRSVRFHAGNVLLQLSGVESREAAAAFREFELKVDTSQLNPLEEGEFFLYQIIGLTAFDDAGRELGRVIDLIETGATDVFVIQPVNGTQHILVANVPEFVLAVEPADGRLVVRLPEFFE